MVKITYIWYGWTSQHRAMPEDTTLCLDCWNALDNYIYAISDKDEQLLYNEERKEELHQLARAWIDDKTSPPLSRSATKRYHRSVPKWIRSAIETQMVKTNSQDVWIIYSQNDTAIKVEPSDRSKLQPLR